MKNCPLDADWRIILTMGESIIAVTNSSSMVEKKATRLQFENMVRLALDYGYVPILDDDNECPEIVEADADYTSDDNSVNASSSTGGVDVPNGSIQASSAENNSPTPLLALLAIGMVGLLSS